MTLNMWLSTVDATENAPIWAFPDVPQSFALRGLAQDPGWAEQAA